MLRFGHIFAILMGMCFLSAFVFPRSSLRVRGGADVVLYPIARPAGVLAAAARGRLFPEAIDPAGADRRVLAEENLRLQAEVAALRMQYEMLQARTADRERLGDIKDWCSSYAVMAPETTGRRQVLKLSPAAVTGTREGMPVLYPPKGIAGRMMKGGAVQLITDSSFAVTGSFGYFRTHEKSKTAEWVGVATQHPLVKGTGDGMMVVDSLPWKPVQESGLAKGHWVILNDSDWPLALQGWAIGKVSESPKPRADSPMFAEIRIQPLTKLTDLQEVMVMNRK